MDAATSATAKPAAAYGHSCTNCVKAKCKCVPREGGGACQRCHRLTKDCQPATFSRKRGSRKSFASSNRTSKLEDKLDSLVSLLQAQQVPPSGSTSAPVSSEQESNNLTSRSRQDFDTQGSDSSTVSGLVGRQADLYNTGITLTPAASTTTSSTPLELRQIPQQDAEQIFEVFRTRFLKHLPFLHLPDNISAKQFQGDRPLTFKAISVICEASRERQTEAGMSLREEIARRVVAAGERSLDLLQAAMVCIIWKIYFTHAKPDIGVFSGICRAMIIDMRLVRVPPTISQVCPKMPPLYDQLEFGEMRTDEERRILLTYYTLSAIVFMSLKHDYWRWFPQLEEHCQKLSLNHSILGDQILVALARISKISNEAAKILQLLSEIPNYGTHAIFQAKSLQAMLDQVRLNLTPQLLESKLVLSHIHCTTILIHEAALFIPLSPSLSSLEPSLEIQRTTHLTSCLHACKATLDNFNGTSVIHMNTATMLPWTHAIQVLFKLSVLEMPGWDRHIVHATADVLSYFSRAAELMETADRDLQRLTGMPENVFTKTGSAFAATMAVWKEHLDRLGVAGSEALGNAGFTGLDTVPGFDVMDTSWLNFSDDGWLFPQ